jgi:flagellar protein FliO/FliZ
VLYEADGLSSLALAIGAIVALLWIALWALRRARPNGAASGDRDCAILRSLALGPRERILVVRIGVKHLVVGVGSAGVSLLCELDDTLPSIQPANAKFAETVRRAVERWRCG